MMLRDWLRISRSQTAAAVIMLCGMFYLIGGGELFSWYGLALIIFSILAHNFSFAHNSVIDVLTGYDTEDPFKSHFPLCNGRVKPFTALKITHIGMVVVTLFAILLAYFGTGNPFYAMSFFTIFILSGFWYNEWTSKIAMWDFVPISICFTSLAVFAYFLVSSEFAPLLILAAVYIFLVEWYEIGIAGEIKEAEIKKEVSLLRYLGMTCGYERGNKKQKIFDMHDAVYYPYMLKMVSLVVIMVIMAYYAFSYGTVLIFMVFTALMLYFNYRLTERQVRDRNRSIRDMACGEILAIFLLPAVLYPIIGLLEVVFLLLFSLAYFCFMNFLNWGTVFRPRV